MLEGGLAVIRGILDDELCEWMIRLLLRVNKVGIPTNWGNLAAWGR